MRSGATRNAVARALNYFEESGLVSRQQRHNKSTVYTLNLTSTQFNTDSSSTEFDTSSTELKTSTSTEFDTLTTKEPSINHQKKNIVVKPRKGWTRRHGGNGLSTEEV